MVDGAGGASSFQPANEAPLAAKQKLAEFHQRFE
jgi:hypothetical protein